MLDFSSAISNDYVMAIGAVVSRMLILLDIEKLMNCTDIGLFKTIAD